MPPTKAELDALFAAHGLALPTESPPARGVRHRPVSGFSKTLDAASLYRALCRRGVSGRRAAEALWQVLGVSRSGVLKYQKHPIEPANQSHDELNASFVVAKHWPKIRRQWRALDPKVQAALRTLAPVLLRESPPT